MTEPVSDPAAVRRPPLPLLTSLRFFAASEVVVFHFFVPSPTDFVHSLLSSGYQAVIFFFVLSGFILAYVYSGRTLEAKSPAGPKKFWAARLGRIWPAYLLALAIGFPMFAYGGLISKITPPKIFFFGLIFTPILLQSFWPPIADAWNGPAWSLSVEMAFYALFPFLLYLTRKLKPLAFLFISFILLLAVQGIREGFHPAASAPLVEWYFYKFFPFFHLTTFLVGMAIGRLFLFGPRISARLSTALFLIGVAGLVLVLGLRPKLPYWMGNDPGLVILFGLVIYGAARPAKLLAPLWGRTMLLLGDASYAMYILHMPLLFWWFWATRQELRLHIPPLLDISLFFGMVVALSIATLLFVERPLRPKLMRAVTGARLAFGT